MQLTNREKVLVIILLLLVVVGVPSVFLIYPKIETYRANSKLLSSLEVEKEEAEATIAKMNENMEEITTLKAEAEELYQLLELTKSYDISLLLSDMQEKHGLVPSSLQISPYQVVSIEPADPEAEKVNPFDIQIDAGALSEEQVEEEQQQSDEIPDFVMKRTADLYFTGEDAAAESFLDEVTNYNKSVIVDGFTVSDIVGVKIFEIRIDFYEFAQPQLGVDNKTSGIAGGTQN